jgi:hypothetical protein
MQQHKVLVVVLLGFFALAFCAEVSHAAERKAARAAAPAAGKHKVILLRKRAAMRGGYSYGRSDVVVPFGHSRAPYAAVLQSPGGPFDSGFFFDSGIAPLNNAPYPR